MLLSFNFIGLRKMALSGSTLAAIAIVVVVIVIVSLIIAASAGEKTPTPTPIPIIPPINPITPVKTQVFTAVPSKPVPAKSAQVIFASKPTSTVYDSKYGNMLPSIAAPVASSPMASNAELATVYNNTYAFLLNNIQRTLSAVLGSSVPPFSYTMKTQVTSPACTVTFVFSAPSEIKEVQAYHINMSQLQNNRLLVFLTIGWREWTIPANYTSTCGAQGGTSIVVPNVQINMSFVASMTTTCSTSNITLSQFALNYIDMLTDLPPNAGIPITVVGQSVVVPVEILPALQMYVGSVAKELNTVAPQTLHLLGSANACNIITALLAGSGVYVVKPPNGFLFNSDLGPAPSAETGTQTMGAPFCFAACRSSNTCGAALSNGSQCILYPYSGDGSTPFVAQIASNNNTPIMSQWLYNGRGFLPTKSTSVMVLSDGKYSLDFTYDYINQAILSAGAPMGQFLTINNDRKTVSWKSTADPVYSRGWIITSRYGLPVVLSTTNSSATQQPSCTVEFNGIAISLFGRLRLGNQSQGGMTLDTTGAGDPSTIYARSN